MRSSEQIKLLEDYVKTELAGDSSGHDWFHVERVRNLAVKIGQKEGADLYLVETAALAHDLGDPKFTGGDETVAPRLIGKKLTELNFSKEDQEHVLYIVQNMSYSKSLSSQNVEKTTEFKCVQDADRVDGMGAIGIARVFAYGGHQGRLIYDPEIKPKTQLTKEEYRSNQSTSINHFYEKLFKLKEQMNTETGRGIAEERQKFMERYLEHFFKEWKGEA